MRKNCRIYLSYSLLIYIEAKNLDLSFCLEDKLFNAIFVLLYCIYAFQVLYTASMWMQAMLSSSRLQKKE